MTARVMSVNMRRSQRLLFFLSPLSFSGRASHIDYKSIFRRGWMTLLNGFEESPGDHKLKQNRATKTRSASLTAVCFDIRGRNGNWKMMRLIERVWLNTLRTTIMLILTSIALFNERTPFVLLMILYIYIFK